MTDKRHTLAKVAFVLAWLGLIGPTLVDGYEAGARFKVAALVRAELLDTARAANVLAVTTRQGAIAPH